MRRLRPRLRLPVRLAALALVAATGLSALGCHRNVEPYDPDEEVVEPDLSRIFPEGAERAARQQASATAGGAAPPPAAPPEGPTSPPPGAGRGAGPGAASGAAASDAAPMRGTVRLAPDLAVPPGAILFIFARTVEGMPPTAVRRVPAPAFPLSFSLGPEDRMIESFPFEGPFEITARIDADGNAMSRNPGDLQGRSGGHLPGEEGIEIVIDEVL